MTDEQQAFQAGYKKAQEDAAYLFGALAYEQANEDMLKRADNENYLTRVHHERKLGV